MIREHVALVFAFAVVACSSASADAPSTNGVNDVLKACEIRVTWTKATAGTCTTCIAYATTPRCACADVDYAGKCSDQESARTSEATCSGVGACIDACAVSDCACIDACYASAPACRTRASALDGCVADVCAQYCQ